MALTPGTRFGSFEISSLLGTGGMGQVYTARDMRLDRRVAIKVLLDSFARDPDRRARFEREARLLASLNHPFIAQIYGVEETPAPGSVCLWPSEVPDTRIALSRLDKAFAGNSTP